MNHSIILFDGVCNFCNSSVHFVITHDKKDVFRYAPLQSPSGQKILEEHSMSTILTSSFLLIEEGKVYARSTASLKVLRHLPWYISWMYALIIIPAPLRDFFYNLVAKYRYKIWGRRASCMIPSEDRKKKFL